MAHAEGLTAEERSKAQIRLIWKVALILAVATAIEFAVAFSLPRDEPFMLFLKNSIFIILTIFKAFYIVGEFMHLRHEVKGLIWAILLPTAFVVWMLVALLVEGDYIFSVLFE